MAQELSRELGQGENGTWTGTIEWICLTHDPEIALTDPDIPAYNDPWPGTGHMHDILRVKNLSLRLLATTQKQIQVVAQYASAGIVRLLGDGKSSEAVSDYVVPTYTERWELITRTEHVVFDINGDPIGPAKDESGEPTGWDVMVPYTVLSLDIRKAKEYYLDPYYAFLAKVNSANFKGLSPGSWLCTGANVEEPERGVMEIHYRFEYVEQGWQARWFNIEKDNATGRWLRFGAEQTANVYNSIDFNLIWDFS